MISIHIFTEHLQKKDDFEDIAKDTKYTELNILTYCTIVFPKIV